jgi:predicted membrane-bound mannosyltransferase
MLAVTGGVAAFRRVNLGSASASFIRFLALYTFLLTAFYSLIAYKTPWCLLSFWHGAILLAGVGTGVLLRSIPRLVPRISLAVVLLIGAVHLGWQAWLASNTPEFASDRRNPYVYAQTSPDILGLVSTVESLARVAPQNHNLVVQVIAPDDDYGPLPWYLRSFNKVGWWSKTPSDLSTQVLIVSPAVHFQPSANDPLRMLGYFQLRPQTLFELWVDPSLWQSLQSSTSPHPHLPQ